MAASAVAVKTDAVGIPCDDRALKIPGLTARIYAIVRNVVSPARISVRTLCFDGSNPKAFVRNLFIGQDV